MLEVSTIHFLTAKQLGEKLGKGILILDTRPAEQFAALHIRGSIQISLQGRFSAWSALLIDPQQELVLVAADEVSAREALDRLARVGIHRVVGCSIADEVEWRDVGLELASIPVRRAQNIQKDWEADAAIQLIDVRSRAEWLKGHLPGAISLPLLDIDSNAQTLDPSKQSVIYCHEGFRATTAASILLRMSSADIGILIDGIEGWLASGLPLEVPDTH